MRRIVLVLTVGAMMAALMMMSVSPALADDLDHFDRDRGFFVIDDDDFDRDFFFFDDFGGFGGFGQAFEQEAESGDINLSYQVS